MAQTPVDVAPLAAAAAATGTGADLVRTVAALSKDELRARMKAALRAKTAAEGEFTICLADQEAGCPGLLGHF
jgi:hypothetical protein